MRHKFNHLKCFEQHMYLFLIFIFIPSEIKQYVFLQIKFTQKYIRHPTNTSWLLFSIRYHESRVKAQPLTLQLRIWGMSSIPHVGKGKMGIRCEWERTAKARRCQWASRAWGAPHIRICLCQRSHFRWVVEKRDRSVSVQSCWNSWRRSCKQKSPIHTSTYTNQFQI